MKKAYYKLTNELMLYYSCNKLQTSIDQLTFIHLALDPIEDSWINIDKVPHKNLVSIWSSDSFKKPVKIKFASKQDQEKFEEAYDHYYDKRWDDMPHLQMSIQDYDELVKKWEVIKKEKPHYIIFSLNDSGPLDKVDLVGKNKLSEQDKQDMKHEHELYLRREKAKELYDQDHLHTDDDWGGPEDNFYEKDLEKYYDRETDFNLAKVYTKQKIGQELKSLVAKKEYPELIGHWASKLAAHEITDQDNKFYNLLCRLIYMKRYQEDKLSYERLDEIADMLIEGKDLSDLPEIQGFNY